MFSLVITGSKARLCPAGAPIGPPPDLPSLLLKERRYLSGLQMKLSIDLDTVGFVCTSIAGHLESRASRLIFKTRDPDLFREYHGHSVHIIEYIFYCT